MHVKSDMGWDELFLRLASTMSEKSKDPSTKTGAVIVDADHRVRAVGYNGFPRGVTDDSKRLDDRATKYQMIVHADLNAIYSAASVGVSLAGCTMYLTGPPCCECTKGIIQAGIKVVVWPQDSKFLLDAATNDRWRSSFMVARSMALEAGVEFRHQKGG